MRGTISLSRAQLDTIHREAQRDYPAADAGPSYWADNVHGRGAATAEGGIGTTPGSVVSVTITPSSLKADGRVIAQLNRAYTHSIVFGLLRDGSIIPSGQAA